MNEIIDTTSRIMDRYDPQERIALVVDEWGAWYAPLPGSNPAFLVQQNSLRDAVLAALNINIFARHAVPRVPHVRAVPGRDVRPGHVRRR